MPEMEVMLVPGFMLAAAAVIRRNRRKMLKKRAEDRSASGTDSH